MAREALAQEAHDDGIRAGHDAEGPTEIPARGWKQVLWRVKDQIAEDHVTLTAAGIGFYAFLSIFPAIAAAIAIAGLVIDPATLTEQINSVAAVLPPEAAGIITAQAMDVVNAQGDGLGLTAILGILLALYSASRGTGGLIEGLNIAYNVKESRGFIKRTLLTYGLTIALVIGVIVALMATAVLPVVVSQIGDNWIGQVISLVRWPILAVFVIFGVAFLYRYAPNRENAQWRWATPGAVLACVLWIAASIGFSIYVTSFGSYNETFGALAGVVVLLLWLWISALVVLVGAELDSELEAQTARPTTDAQARAEGDRSARSRR